MSPKSTSHGILGALLTGSGHQVCLVKIEYRVKVVFKLNKSTITQLGYVWLILADAVQGAWNASTMGLLVRIQDVMFQPNCWAISSQIPFRFLIIHVGFLFLVHPFGHRNWSLTTMRCWQLNLQPIQYLDIAPVRSMPQMITIRKGIQCPSPQIETEHGSHALALPIWSQCQRF